MDNFLFQCELCGGEFPANPNAMVSIESSSYLFDDNQTFLIWEGGSWIGNSIPLQFSSMQVSCPPELSNNAICVCDKCRPGVTGE